MTSDTMTEPLGRMLDEMREALLAGDLGALGELAPSLEAALETLALADPPAAHLLKAKAERNLLCLEAASRGVRAARRRLEEIRQAASGTVVAYDGRGRRCETRPESAPRQRF